MTHSINSISIHLFEFVGLGTMSDAGAVEKQTTNVIITRKKQRQNASNHTGCMYFIEKKGKYCGMRRRQGEEYCGLHLQPGEDDDARVKCPWGNHTVLASALAKHIPVCPDYLLKQGMLDEVYYEAGVNKLHDRDVVELPSVWNHGAFNQGAKDTLSNRRLAAIIDMGQAMFHKVVQKIEMVWERLGCGERRSRFVYDDSATRTRADLSKGEKHSVQQESIFENMKEFGFFRKCDTTTFMEFGSGKGTLTGRFVEMLGSKRNDKMHHIVLLDRQSFKLKADRSLRDENMMRIRCDIADFNPTKLPCMQKDSCTWCVYGKHLCGPATDFSINCCIRNRNGNPKSTGFAIAPCCHHLSSWDQYVGAPVLEKEGISPQEFEIICYMSGWATCGGSHSKGRHDEVKNDDTDDLWRPHKTIDRSRRVELGNKCKDLIDRGRILHAASLDDTFHAEDVLYVHRSITVENRLLLYHKK